MAEIVLDGIPVGDDHPPYTVAEIGNNHMGDLEEAKRLIKMAHDAGANAVKFQKRDNAVLFTKEFYNSPYNSEAAYAATYGAHRDHFEFTLGEYMDLKAFADMLGMSFIATPFDLPSVDFLEAVDVPFYKIASAGITNPLLMQRIVETGKPIVASLGGANWDRVCETQRILTKHGNSVVLLHCTASYPTMPKDLGLLRIQHLAERFPEQVIGFSDHDDGIAMAVEAYALGARVFEKHITMSHVNRGTDHAFSLEAGGLRGYINNLRDAEASLQELEHPLPSEERPLYKMGYAVYPAHDLQAGDVVLPDDLVIKSPMEGLSGLTYRMIVGKELARDVKKEQPLSWDDFVYEERDG